MKVRLLFIPMVLLLCCIPASVFSQKKRSGNNPFATNGPPPPPPDPVDTTDVPLDGGLSILLAAGVAYGIRRRAKRKEEEKS